MAKDGAHKVLERCSPPLTGRRVVDRIITDLCVLDVADGGLRPVETAPGVDEGAVRAATGARLMQG